MKKKSLKGLKLSKELVSQLYCSGGENPTGDTLFCPSVNVCETRDYTRCNGEQYCQFYDTGNW